MKIPTFFLIKPCKIVSIEKNKGKNLQKITQKLWVRLWFVFRINPLSGSKLSKSVRNANVQNKLFVNSYNFLLKPYKLQKPQIFKQLTKLLVTTGEISSKTNIWPISNTECQMLKFWT